ncbi:uncharacterized protein LOC135203921 [Macrobrachium nipponense]|uniref:uncharacterized protein LOC135203921 n=1 Tax=Macrobrachium nipponense TaxID=159736 RepID=UPI0030C7D745
MFSPKMTSLSWRRKKPRRAGPGLLSLLTLIPISSVFFLLSLSSVSVAATEHHHSGLRKIGPSQHSEIWRTLALEKSGGGSHPHHQKGKHLGLDLYPQSANLDPLTLWAERLKATSESGGMSRSKGPTKPRFHSYGRVHHNGRNGGLVARPTRQTLSAARALDQASHLLLPENLGVSVMSHSAALSSDGRDNITDIINSVVIKGEFGTVITGRINKTTEYLFEFFYNTSQLEKNAVRVTVSSADCDYTNPLLVVVRQQRGVLSWQLPLEPPSSDVILEEYRTVSRTLCPVKNYKVMLQGSLDTKQRLFIDLSTSSPKNITYSVTAEFEDNFHIELHNLQTFEITPSQPVFYEFVFPDDVEMVLVKANAQDDFCAMVAIQNITISNPDDGIWDKFPQLISAFVCE